MSSLVSLLTEQERKIAAEEGLVPRRVDGNSPSLTNVAPRNGRLEIQAISPEQRKTVPHWMHDPAIPRTLHDWRRLPNVFRRTPPRESTRELFISWVERAGLCPGRTIPIYLGREKYSRATVHRSIGWLQRRGLLELAQRGGGRGRASLYRVTWTFDF